jgi:acyl carrier protein
MCRSGLRDDERTDQPDLALLQYLRKTHAILLGDTPIIYSFGYSLIIFSYKESKMENSEILTRVKNVVSNVLKIESSEITDDSNFVFDLGADSLQSVELVAGFEEEFDIEMDQDKALEVQNINDAVNFIAEYL